MRALGLFSHRLAPHENGSTGSNYFLGEHVMTDDGAPGCGMPAQLVAPTTNAGGFAVVCRQCLRDLLKAARPIKARKRGQP
jgi:hypothetical protein